MSGTSGETRISVVSEASRARHGTKGRLVARHARARHSSARMLLLLPLWMHRSCCIHKRGEQIMRHLPLISSVLALIFLSGCSTAAGRPEDRSILDVIHSVEVTPAPHKCALGQVDYCLFDRSQTKQCACVDSREVAYGLTPSLQR